MPRSSRVAALCALAACSLVLHCAVAFLPAPQAQGLRGQEAVLAGAAVATVPVAANAFYFDGAVQQRYEKTSM